MPPDVSSKNHERRWAERIRAGDGAAFEALFRAQAEGLCRFVRQYVKSSEVAEELIQDLFLRLWERREELSPQGSVKSYLYAAARNRALNHLEHRRVEQRWVEQTQHEEVPLPQTPEEELHYQEFTEAVWKAIQELPERRRLVFTLSRQHGLTYREIAVALDISVKTVETQMSQAFAALRQRLSVYLPSVLLLSAALFLFGL